MNGVLLLNSGYQPLCVVSFRRAVNLLLRDRVEAAGPGSVSVHGGSSSIDVPHALRLKRYVNVPRRASVHWTRKGLFARDAHTCGYCGRRAGLNGELERDDLTVDHIVPRSRGGESTWTNTVTCCKACNQRKGDRLPNEAGMRLRFEPRMPRTNYVLVSGDIPAAWKIWLET